jgi:hypothetical protein
MPPERNADGGSMNKHVFLLVWFVELGVTAACGGGGSGGGGVAASQKLPIGSPCASDADCGGAGFMCMTDHPGGYCVKMCDISNHDANCPSDSICQFDGTSGECHLKCASTGDCRTGYMCAPASLNPGDTASHAYCDVADMSDGGAG